MINKTWFGLGAAKRKGAKRRNKSSRAGITHSRSLLMEPLEQRCLLSVTAQDASTSIADPSLTEMVDKFLADITPHPDAAGLQHKTADMSTQVQSAKLSIYNLPPLLPELPFDIPELTRLRDGIATINNSILRDSNARPSIWGQTTVLGGAEYRLYLDDNGMNISNWTIDWGDGSPLQTVKNQPWIIHHYADTSAHYEITASANGGVYAMLSDGIVDTRDGADSTVDTTDIDLIDLTADSLAYINQFADSLLLSDDGSLLVTALLGDAALSEQVSMLQYASYQYTLDGEGEGGQGLDVEVQSVPPVLSVIGDQTASTGQDFILSEIGVFSHPSVTGTFSYQIDWGDGTDWDVGTPTIVSQGSDTSPLIGAIGGQHTYSASGTYYVAATVIDPDGDFDTKTFLVTVQGEQKLAPVLVPSSGLDLDSVSDGGVYYGTGDVVVSAGDVGLIYTNQLNPQDFGNGYGWQQTDQPYVTKSGSSTVVVFGPKTVYWFNAVGNDYVAQFGALQSLEHDSQNHVFVFTDLDGTVYQFSDFTYGGNRMGLFEQMTSIDGAMETVTAWTADGKIGEIQKTLSATTAPYESRVYNYFTAGDDVGRLESIILRANAEAVTPNWIDYAKISYAYYGAGDANGLPGDLKTVVYKVWQDGDWTGNDTYYYRYYTDTARAHLLKMTFSPQEYQNAKDTYPDPTTASDNDLKSYSGEDFNYNASRQVSTATVEGDYAYTFTTSGLADSNNTWKANTVETRQDGSTKTVYTNYLGQVILSDLTDAGGNHTITWNQYDSNGHLIISAQPSAFVATGPYYSESYADLVNYGGGNSPYLNNSAGLFYVTTYYASTDSGIDNDTSGGVAGYVHQEAIAQGEDATRGTPGQTGGPVLLFAYDYFARWEGTYANHAAAVAAHADIIYPVAHDTSYTVGVGANETERGAVSTTYAYAWYGTTLQMKEATDTLPVVTVAQNGPGGATGAAAKQWFDDHGNLIWSMDERGYLSHYFYSSVTGLLDQIVEDVNTTALVLPSGCNWALTLTANPNGRNLTTDYTHDAQGRVTQILGPEHYAVVSGTTQNIRTASWTVYLDAAHEIRYASGYVVVATGAAVILGPISITKTDDDGRVTDQIQAAYSGPASGLAIAAISRSDFTAWTTYQYQDQNSLLVSTRVYHNIPTSGEGAAGTNYDQTNYGYETFPGTTYTGRPNKVQTPDGTITRYVYDARGNVTKTYIGLNDAGATNADPTGGGTNGMKLVSWNIYDYGLGGGDGLLTESRSCYTDDDFYATTYYYDWRDRLTDVSTPADEVTTHHVVTHYQYDNLGRTVLTQTYADTDDNYFIYGSGKIIGTYVDPYELRAQTKNLYDSLGRVYESRVYQVGSYDVGVIDNYLPTDYWYDAAGNLIKTATGKLDSGAALPAYGAAQKYAYDSLGRLVMSYTCFDTDETDYEYADDVGGDTVVEQTQTWYNQASEIIATATYQRLPDDGILGSTGALTATSGNASYVTASVAWYDGIGRVIETANLGREDVGAGSITRNLFYANGTLKTAADGLPWISEQTPFATYTQGDSSNDAYIVAKTVYDSAGRVQQTIDNVGRIDETQYDDAGRVTRTIENFDGLAYGAPGSGFDSNGDVLATSTAKDVTVDYQYDSFGRLATTTAYNPNGSTVVSQQTRYLYDATLNASWLIATVYSDSSDALSQNPTTNVWTITSGTDHVSTHYDRLGRADQTTDQRGVVHQYVFDSAGRLTADIVSDLGSSGVVDGSVLRIDTTYDDIGRVEYVTSYSDVSGDSYYILNQVKYVYDGWGNVYREFQEHNGPVDDSGWNSAYWSANVRYDYDDGSYDSDAYYDSAEGYDVAKYVRLTGVTYPRPDYYTVGRIVDYLYTNDAIDNIMSRVERISTNGATAAYRYLGANTVVTEDYTDMDVILDYSANNFAAWDRFGRVVDKLWTDYGASQTLDEFTYIYDRSGNVTERDNVLNSALDEIYAYDELDRLTSSQRADDFDQSWTLDGSGNFSTYNDDGATQTRTVNEANEIEGITGGSVTPLYDLAGNMIFGPKTGDETTGVHYIYDAWNRLVAVYEDDMGASGGVIAQFKYDGLNRRIKKTDDAGWGDHYYYNQDWQMIEDRWVDDWEGLQSIDSYVWNPDYVDSPLVCLHDGNADGDLDDDYFGDPGSDWRRYYLTDANHNVTTTIRYDYLDDIAYDGISRNVYTPYGTVTRYGEDWSGSSVEELFDSPLYAGYFFDVETALYQARNRYYDSGLSIWIGRDPIESTPNLYAYCGGNPTNATDPSGLSPFEYHHIVAEWYAQYSSYGVREQGLRILLSHDFHVALHNQIGQLWRAVRSGDMSQFMAYNRMLLIQMRMFPQMIRDSWRAAAATGSSMFAWRGGAQAVAGTLGYNTMRQAAMGAVGTGVLIGGGVYVGSLILEHGEALTVKQEIEFQNKISDIFLEGGQALGRRMANRVFNELMTVMDTSKCDIRKVAKIKEQYIDLVACKSGIDYLNAQMRVYPRPAQNVPNLLLISAHEHFPWLVNKMEEAGGRPKKLSTQH